MMPTPRHEFIIYAAFGESSLDPTFIASPRASEQKKSDIHGITTKEAIKLHNEIICIFFFTSSVILTSASAK
jgi:hypothetical protein